VAKAITEGKQPADIYAECLTAMDKAGSRSDRHEDASILNNIPPSDGADNDNAFGSKVTAAVKKRLQARNRSVTVNSQN
jgi:hypothetical protein